MSISALGTGSGLDLSSLVESTPRQPAASPPSVSGNVPQPPPAPPPPAEAPAVMKQMDLDALLERVGEQISEYSRQIGRELEFQPQSEAGRVIILVKVSDTGELVRAIPPEEVQRLSEALAAGQPALINLRA